MTAAANPCKLNEYLRVRFKDVERRNNIVNLFHAFTNAAGNSPMTFVKTDSEDKFEPIYPIPRMTLGQRDALLIDVKQSEARVSSARANLKEAGGKIPHRRTEITYKA